MTDKGKTISIIHNWELTQGLHSDNIVAGDMEIMGRLMSAERLAVKRAHAARHPEGRTAELMAHIEAQAQTIREAWELLQRFNHATYEVIGPYTELDNVRHAYGKWRAAHKEE